jgi:hypothetical protein
MSWYLKGRAQVGMGARTRQRVLAERVFGPEMAAAMARQLTIIRARTLRRLTRTGRSSSQQLDAIRDAYRGERCIIIGNGPSLNKTDLSLLDGEHTFGLNRLYMLFESLGFGTEFHVVVNRLVVEQVPEDLVRVPGRLVTTWPNRDLLGKRDDAIFLQKIVGPIFSKDPRVGIWEGATVTYVAMQLAYWLGFSRVMLIGVDHRFSTQGPAHKEVTSQSDDPNHFDPNYFGKGFRWQLPDLETSEIAYGLARKAFEAEGRTIVDCTVDGALQVFPKGNLEAELGKPPE